MHIARLLIPCAALMLAGCGPAAGTGADQSLSRVPPEDAEDTANLELRTEDSANLSDPVEGNVADAIGGAAASGAIASACAGAAATPVSCAKKGA